MTVLNEVSATTNFPGGPTDPLGAETSLSTDAATPATPASVLIYCKGEPVEAPRWGKSFALCRCGQLVRVVW